MVPRLIASQKTQRSLFHIERRRRTDEQWLRMHRHTDRRRPASLFDLHGKEARKHPAPGTSALASHPSPNFRANPHLFPQPSRNQILRASAAACRTARRSSSNGPRSRRVTCDARCGRDEAAVEEKSIKSTHANYAVRRSNFLFFGSIALRRARTRHTRAHQHVLTLCYTAFRGFPPSLGENAPDV